MEHYTRKRECPVCENEDITVLFEQNFSEIANNNLLNSYNVVKCNVCGCCYADSIPSQDHFDKYYKELSKYEQINNKVSIYDLQRFNITAEFISKILKNRDAKIVEIGCATGLLLVRLRELGYNNLTGIDPSPGCIETVTQKYGISGFVSDLNNLSLKPGSVECLILVGVLEHIRDVDYSLQKLHEILSENGFLIIAVPDASRYFEGKDAPFQEFSLEHINFFGPISLENLLIKNGFKKNIVQQSMIEMNCNTYTPILMSSFTKIERKKQKKKWIRDYNTVENLKTYIVNSYNQDTILFKKLDDLEKTKVPIIVWGTGALTLRLLKYSNLKNIRILVFVDSNPKYQGNKINGIDIISPNALKTYSETILIVTYAFQKEIEDQIRNDLKINNNVIKLF